MEATSQSATSRPANERLTETAKFDVGESAAANYVVRARKAGHLPPTRKGQKKA
jgi:hypothetical protein